MCDSNANFDTKWIDTDAFPKLKQDDFYQRLQHAGAQDGVLSVSLMWNGWTDLDLHVRCPCGKNIFHGDRKCACGGELDVDMNASALNKSITPVENVYFKCAKKGTYGIEVKLFNFRADEPRKVPFTVRIKQGAIENDYQNAVSALGEVCKVVSFHFDPDNVQGISFAEHVKKFNSDWIISPRAGHVDDDRMRLAWLLVRGKLSSKYGIPDTTPPEWESLLDSKRCLVCLGGSTNKIVKCVNKHSAGFHAGCLQQLPATINKPLCPKCQCEIELDHGHSCAVM